MERMDVVIVGGGQAGLATSHELTRRDMEHVVLERGRTAEAWRRRWDSFCFVTPNWTARLPGHPYDGDDPDAFMPRDAIVSYLQRYARSFEAPVREGVNVISVEPASDGFFLRTSAGDTAARSVVVATGAYQRPHRPQASETIPAACSRSTPTTIAAPAPCHQVPYSLSAAANPGVRSPKNFCWRPVTCSSRAGESSVGAAATR